MMSRKTETQTVMKKRRSKSFQEKVIERKTNFKFRAPEAVHVSVAGTFNDWNTESFPLKKSKESFWEGELVLGPGRYEYRFFVDERWENNPGAKFVPNPFGSTNCVLEVK